MSLSNLGLVIAVNAVGAITPGPDLFLVLRLASRSRKHAFAGIAGISTALLMWSTLAVVGASAVLNRYPWVLSYIQLFGAVWLTFMALSLARGVYTHYVNRPGPASVDVSEVIGTVGSAYRMGALTNLSNPKVLVYFTAILAPILPVGAPWWVGAIYVVAIIATALVVFGVVAFFVSTEAVRARLLSVTHLIDAVAAVLFAVFAAVLFYEGLSALLG